jgi:hypothetical protein
MVTAHSASGRRKAWVWVAALTVVAAAGMAGAFIWPIHSGEGRHVYSLAPEGALPEQLRKAPPNVQEAYRFAIANRDVLRQIPCYCGCGAEHQSSVECYIKEVKADGSIVFDPMSYG